MKKYIYILILIPLLFLSCDYSPIYSNQNNYDFEIEKIQLNGDAEINNLIDKKLKKYNKSSNVKKFSIFASSSYLKSSQSKNLSGKTTNYEIIINVNFQVEKENKIKNFKFDEKFLIKNYSNKFEENNLEKIKKENSIDLMINKLVTQISQM